MVNVVRLTFRLNSPHRDLRIRKVSLVKMKDNFLSFDIQNLLHDFSLVKYVYLSVITATVAVIGPLP